MVSSIICFSIKLIFYCKNHQKMEKSSGSTENSSEMQIIETCKKPKKNSLILVIFQVATPLYLDEHFDCWEFEREVQI